MREYIGYRASEESIVSRNTKLKKKLYLVSKSLTEKRKINIIANWHRPIMWHNSDLDKVSQAANLLLVISYPSWSYASAFQWLYSPDARALDPDICHRDPGGLLKRELWTMRIFQSHWSCFNLSSFSQDPFTTVDFSWNPYLL